MNTRVLVVLVGSCFGVTGCCQTASTARLMELVNLVPERDAEHSLEVKDNAGTSWFRSKAAVLTDSDFDWQQGGITKLSVSDEEYQVIAPIRASSRDMALHWSRTKEGAAGGLIVRGELRLVCPIRGVPLTMLRVAFASLEEAREFLKSARKQNSP